jgi:predicted RNase H-like nuclease (RuvC/YqgF family)
MAEEIKKLPEQVKHLTAENKELCDSVNEMKAEIMKKDKNWVLSKNAIFEQSYKLERVGVYRMAQYRYSNNGSVVSENLNI